MVVDGTKLLLHNAAEEALKYSGTKQPKAREYNKKAEMEKIVFRKPSEQGSILPKLLMLLAACVAVGIFLGIQANSYYEYQGGKVESNFSCCFAWLTVESLPIVTSPFHSSVFMTGFMVGFGALALIGLFIYLDSEQKKASRVGHEHGNAHLGTPKDFKNYKNRFMEK